MILVGEWTVASIDREGECLQLGLRVSAAVLIHRYFSLQIVVTVYFAILRMKVFLESFRHAINEFKT